MADRSRPSAPARRRNSSRWTADKAASLRFRPGRQLQHHPPTVVRIGAFAHQAQRRQPVHQPDTGMMAHAQPARQVADAHPALRPACP